MGHGYRNHTHTHTHPTGGGEDIKQAPFLTAVSRSFQKQTHLEVTVFLPCVELWLQYKVLETPTEYMEDEYASVSERERERDEQRGRAHRF